VLVSLTSAKTLTCHASQWKLPTPQKVLG
jgi:hypothetical protein